jgi:hypothetical protein
VALAVVVDLMVVQLATAQEQPMKVIVVEVLHHLQVLMVPAEAVVPVESVLIELVAVEVVPAELALN